MISRAKDIKIEFPGIPIEQIHAGMGRLAWLQQMIDADESVIDLGGVGTLLATWHKNYKCLDDLSGYGPPNQLAGEVIKGDIQSTPFTDDKFDVAVMTEVLEHVPDPVRAMREAGRIAKRVLITVPNELAWTNGLSFKMGGHFRYYTAEILAAQLRSAGLAGEIGMLAFGTWAFWLACVGKEKSSRSVLPKLVRDDEDQSPLAQARRLADADDPIEARKLVAQLPHFRIEGIENFVTCEGELCFALDKRLAHLESREAYRQFYATETPERPFFEEEKIPDAHRMCPRVGIIRREIDRQHAETVLELGCLDGWVLLNLGMAGYRGIGVDLNAPAIAEASRRARKYALPCDFVEGFIEDFDVPKRFDAVLLLEILEHVLNVDVVLAVAEKHLGPGGRVYISAPLTPPPHKHEREQREHVRLITEAKMRAILNGPGRTQRWYEQMQVPDGLHHFGAYSLAASPPIDEAMLVAIPTVGQNWHFLRPLLSSITKYIHPCDTLVICDEPTPGELEFFRDTAYRTSISRTRRGLVPAINVAFELFLEDGRWGSLMLLDDSIELEPGWDKALQRMLKAHPEFGWVACQQYENPVTPWTSFCSLMSRAAAETIREFDLIYSPMHYDDADAIMRLRKAGFDPHGIPFRVHHKHDQAATPLWRLPEHQICAALSREAFKWRWGLSDFDWKTIPVHEPCERCKG